MKYRVRLDLAFESEADASGLMAFAKGLVPKAVNVNAGAVNQETSFCENELCRHDEGLPCTKLERVEVGKG